MSNRGIDLVGQAYVDGLADTTDSPGNPLYIAVKDQSHQEFRIQFTIDLVLLETEDVIYRTPVGEENGKGFVLLPDLDWDRKTLENLHLLALVETDDIWSLRDLKRKHLSWLYNMKAKIVSAPIRTYPVLEENQLKVYIHYQPTYYYLHIHVVHAALEAGTSQAVGKAVGLESIISQLETMVGDDEARMHLATLSYTIGDASDLWKEVLEPLSKQVN
ncbi:hypothetical protein BBP40_000345 [Aspergillus hancockii]|nr:hypothetical protein BBP40_000345 [Aspergillus hancockii]